MNSRPSLRAAAAAALLGLMLNSPAGAEVLRFTLPAFRADSLDGCRPGIAPLDSLGLIELWRYDHELTLERSRPPVSQPGTEETMLVFPGPDQVSYGVTSRTPWSRRSCMSNLVTFNGRASSDPPGESPDGFWLGLCRPNPVRNLLMVPVGLPVPGELSLDVFDVTGRRVARLASGSRSSGVHLVLWDARNAAPGVYLIRARVRGWQAMQRVLVLR